MTEASLKALAHLRDFSTLKWYVIPLLAVGMISSVPVAMSIIGMGILGWRY